MSLGHETNRADIDARNAQASAIGCCGSGLALLLILAILLAAIARLAESCSSRPAPVAPYSICERCGRLLDASHAPCVPESDLAAGGSMMTAARSGGP